MVTSTGPFCSDVECTIRPLPLFKKTLGACHRPEGSWIRSYEPIKRFVIVRPDSKLKDFVVSTGLFDQFVVAEMPGTVSSDRMAKTNMTEEERRELARKAIAVRWRDKTKVTPATLELVKHACADGATVANICHCLGISEDTFYRWKDTVPEFGRAVKEGRRIEHDRLVNKLVEMALNGNVSCLIYCLKARHGLLDNQVNNVIENKVAITFQLPDAMKPEQYLKTLATSAEVVKPEEVTRALAKPGVKAKVLKELTNAD